MEKTLKFIEFTSKMFVTILASLLTGLFAYAGLYIAYLGISHWHSSIAYVSVIFIFGGLFVIAFSVYFGQGIKFWVIRTITAYREWKLMSSKA